VAGVGVDVEGESVPLAERQPERPEVLVLRGARDRAPHEEPRLGEERPAEKEQERRRHVQAIAKALSERTPWREDREPDEEDAEADDMGVEDEDRERREADGLLPPMLAQVVNGDAPAPEHHRDADHELEEPDEELGVREDRRRDEAEARVVAERLEERVE